MKNINLNDGLLVVLLPATETAHTISSARGAQSALVTPEEVNA